MTGLLTAIGYLENLTFLVLFGLSVWSIALIWDRYKTLKLLNEKDSFLEAEKIIISKGDLKTWAKASEGLRRGTLATALSINGFDYEKIDRAVKSFLTIEKNKLEKGFTALATLGSNAPFIGLFGTVLGIIKAFGLLSSQKSDTNALMASISFALIATAAGLFVAIPAVIAYNAFNKKLKLLLSECEAIKDLYLSRGNH